MFWATKSCFRTCENVNLSLMVSCQDDVISPTVILCSLNQTLSSSFSSHLQSFSCFILFYFLVHISASFVILPRPFPVFFFPLSPFSLPITSFHHHSSFPRPHLSIFGLGRIESEGRAPLSLLPTTPPSSHFVPIWVIQLGETLTHFALSIFLLSCEFLSTYSRGPHRWKI